MAGNERKKFATYPVTGIFLMAGMLAAQAAIADAHERAPIDATVRFAFYSDFDTNLNDALIAAGLAREREQAERFQGAGGAGCFDALAPSMRHGWNLAVDWYREVVSPADWDDRQQYLLRMHLAGFGDQVADERARQFVGIAAGFMAAAAPAYGACHWPARDAENRRWIKGLVSQLEAHGAEITRRLEALYRMPFAGLPIPVDVVETVSWSGANSMFWDPAGGHLLIASPRYRGREALEIVFHEASHQLMRPGRPAPAALYDAARAQQAALHGDLWHVVQFYTTGETVRRVLAASGESGYTPLLYGIFERGGWVEFRVPIEATWPAYLDGEQELAAAATDLIRAVREQQPR